MWSVCNVEIPSKKVIKDIILLVSGFKKGDGLCWWGWRSNYEVLEGPWYGY